MLSPAKPKRLSKAAPTAETSDLEEDTITHAEADAQGIPHSHASDGSLAQSEDSAQAPQVTSEAVTQAPQGTTETSRKFPWIVIVGIATLVALGASAMTILDGRD